jgi:serine/threonine protein kinase
MLSIYRSIQYIPPELSICATYHDEQADIWALGISLYRMLVGKYPFHNQLADAAAVSHQDVFKKMFKYDFVIPKTLSPGTYIIKNHSNVLYINILHPCTDARDLIQRMLAPEKTRASFDLVMFHPWLKSYIFWPDQSIKVSENTKIFSKKPKNKSKTKEAKKVMRAFRKAILFIIKGPHPPPASYYDLVNKRHRQ